MKLAYLLRYFPTFSETFVYDEIAAMEPLIGPPRVWALDPGPEAALDPGLRGPLQQCRVVPRAHHPTVAAHAATRGRAASRRSRGVQRRWQRWGGRRKDLDRAVWLASQLQSEGVEHVHVHFAAEVAEVAWVIHRMVGIPYSVTVHARDLFCPRGSLPDILSGARVVVTISEYNRILLRRDHDLGQAPVLIRVGVPEPAAGESFGAGPDPCVLSLLAVGRLVEKKGFDILLAALARLGHDDPPWQLDVVGDGPLAPSLRRSADELGVTSRVRWLGAVPRARVLRRYGQGVDLLVAPCRVAADGDMDGIPVVLMEAMIRGIPVLSTDLSGIPELIQHGRCGLLVPPGDVVALAQAIRSLAAAPETRRRLAEQGRQRVRERHGLEAQARLLVQALQ